MFRSPDLTPLDFWLWGYIKTLVYQEELPDDDEQAEYEMIARIHAAFATITREMIQKSTSHVIKRCRVCLARRGHHIQALIKTN